VTRFITVALLLSVQHNNNDNVFISWPVTMWGPATVMVRNVRLSVCHTRIYPILSEIDVWLLGNSTRKSGFPIQNMPSDSRSEARFRHFECFRVAISPIQTENGPVGLVYVVNESV